MKGAILGCAMVAALFTALAYMVNHIKTCERVMVEDIIINGTTGTAELGQVSVCK
jgi:hypothetical protein